MPIDLRKYKPYPVNLAKEDILEARSRLVAYLQDQWRDIDFRPRSPFGDLCVTPGAYLETATNQALTRFIGDLDPANISQGLYYNREVVDLFFRMLGVSADDELPGYGLVRFVFDTSGTYTFESPIRLSIGDWNCTSMSVEDNTGFITVHPAGASQAAGDYRLTPLGGGLFVFYLPFSTMQADLPAEGTTFEMPANFPEQLVAIEVANSFTRPVLDGAPEVLINRATRQYARPGFSCRANLISYISACYPEVKYVGVYGTGDPEMTRRRHNLMGVSTPETDIYVRESNSLSWRNDVVLVKYDPEAFVWRGAIETPTGVCLFDRSSIFQTNSFDNNRGTVRFYAGTNDPQLLPDQAAYSIKASHAIEMEDFSPETQASAYVSSVYMTIHENDYQILSEGQFTGDLFSAIPDRFLQATFADYRSVVYTDGTFWTLFLGVKDLKHGDSGTLLFRGTEANDSSPIALTCSREFIDKQENLTYRRDYRSLVGGLTLTFTRVSGGNEPEVILRDVLSQIRFNMAVQAQVARLTVRYAYDPAVFKLHHRERDVRLSHTRTMLVKAFAVSEITSLKLVVTEQPGGKLDKEGAAQAVADYLNGINFPERYQESDVFRAIEPFGAEGIDRVEPVIIHHTTPADYFVQDGDIYQPNKTVSRSFTDIPYATGHTVRNHMFHVDPAVITITRRSK